ncbi:MAG: 3-oxoacyl-[acyl-carrier-protein] reductase [Rickettsiales bacterium TMED254]|nr:3-oxoacyl-[acyl-carrier-protein] reductase [Rickettsiales bacterium]RPF77040.1 MAG: 3-oxoacyl-[acyl-carrier-protein] reductase [Rickettsiales bacterium TMED254]|tara:strand:+ start:2290 stop:3030 length:741 start_codon:yes stop_codon:yes gene_type:complete
MNTELEKKNILVTGATGGIGKAIVKSFNSYKNNILLTGTNSSKLTAFSKELGKNSDFVECDFSKYENIEKILDKIKSYFDNKIDVLVNNAGITRDNIALRMRREEWLDVINLNLNSTFFLTKEILKLMIKKRYGKIINISSVIGSTGNLGQANYAASKAGLEGMTKSLALEVASRGININCISPGFIETAMTKNILEHNKEEVIKNIPLKRIGLPEDISSLTNFLASDNASYITGQTFHVNGGMLM